MNDKDSIIIRIEYDLKGLRTFAYGDISEVKLDEFLSGKEIGTNDSVKIDYAYPGEMVAQEVGNLNLDGKRIKQLSEVTDFVREYWNRGSSSNKK